LLTRTNNNSSQLQAPSYQRYLVTTTFTHSLRISPSIDGYTSPGIVQQIIKKIVKRNAPTADSIVNIATKLLPRKTVLFFSYIFNGYLRFGHFPTSCTLSLSPSSNLDHRHLVDYSAIALLSSLIKNFECVNLVKLNAAISPKIINEQFAFSSQNSRSTTHRIFGLIYQLAANINSKLRTAAVFLDAEKTFD